MVFSADEAEDNDYSPAEFTAAAKRKRRDMDMEVGQQRPRTATRWSLQNFSSAPTLDITWGCQRQLRCVKDRDAASELTHSELYSDFRKRRSSLLSDDGDDGGGGIDAVREKLMLDLRAEVNQMQADLFKGGKHSVTSSAAAATAAVAVEPRPWNLRTRRAVCKDPTNSQSNLNGGSGFDRKPSFSPAKTADVKSPAKIGTSFGGGGGGGDEKGKRPKFAVALSKQQIEEDFLALTGARPARRPKKRAKCVQRQIDVMFPGYWLTEVTADMYKVNEQPPDGSKK